MRMTNRSQDHPRERQFGQRVCSLFIYYQLFNPFSPLLKVGDNSAHEYSRVIHHLVNSAFFNICLLLTRFLKPVKIYNMKDRTQRHTLELIAEPYSCIY